ncbi:glucose dehydrogenase [FAD, quinone]-like [Pectinophora gossypiella]|uniref:glucose dehydrogenase [FAD, quinone]-like n=1 Tax=Pectinophora gossypiella TaxID=13191 RepID=UPI00214E3109|nr:glucose dehydrogenase [FAD, quinone]-like [Pectinophora gossypiella]
MTGNITDELCKICDGRIECAPTAILLISLVHTLYGHIGPEPDYFGKNKESLIKQVWKPNPKFEEDPYPKYKSYTYHESMAEEEKKKDEVNIHRSTEYDFIIVGGGTAGCVLASRLSENRKWKVLLVEAGPEEPKMALIPGLTSEFRGSALDWQFSMRPKKGFCQNRSDRGCEVVQGRVLGGTSSINDMAYVRGSPADYDEWALSGNEGWSFATVLPYFKYSEGNYDKDVSKNKYFHSTQGPLDVGRYPYVDVNVDVLLSAFNELGYNYTDVNGRNQLGFMRIQTTSYFGERVSSYTAFIEPIRKMRTNIDIITEALVFKILFEEDGKDTRAVGVDYIKNGTMYRAYANKEVIISAGAINSPKLLMQSGIGPKDYLEYLDVKVTYDLPVGGNFHDHVSVCLPVIRLTKTATISKFTEKLKDITTYYSKGIGPLSANFQVVAFIETSLSDVIGTPDIEVRFKGHDSNMYYDKIDMCISLLTPKSRGQIVLNASDPIFGKPLIYPNFLKDPSDEKKLLEGIQEAVKLFDTEVFRTAGVDFDPRPILNNECKDHERVSEDFWSCIIRHFSAPLHNYVGSCKMGPTRDPEAIVDNELRVYGVSNLRVVDASVIPKITRGPTSAAVIMIAEKASDLIKTSWY